LSTQAKKEGGGKENDVMKDKRGARVSHERQEWSALRKSHQNAFTPWGRGEERENLSRKGKRRYPGVIALGGSGGKERNNGPFAHEGEACSLHKRFWKQVRRYELVLNRSRRDVPKKKRLVR